jgi:hypothetical protein
MGICVFIFKITLVLKKARCIQYPYGENYIQRSQYGFYFINDEEWSFFFSQTIPKIRANTRIRIGSFSTHFGLKTLLSILQSHTTYGIEDREFEFQSG